MLRESSIHDGSSVELSAIHGEALDHCGVTSARLLVDFAEASVARDVSAQATLRNEIVDSLGSKAAVDSAAIVAIFTAVVRIADSTGIPLEPYKEEGSKGLREELALDAFAHERHA